MTKSALRCELACLGMLVTCISVAVAGEDPAARPGDEALSCDQIYAEGMTIVQKEQQQRDATRSRMQTQANGTAALLVAASTVGQLDPTHATAIAAQVAAEGMVKNQVDVAAQAGAAKPDARKERLRTLWTQKHCVKN